MYYTLFDNYIFDQNLGYQIDDEGRQTGTTDFEAEHALDAYQFTAVDAEFYGFEAEFEYQLYRDVNSEIHWGLMADSVRATERASGEDLPRIAPMRIGTHLDALWGDWSARLGWLYAFEQDNLAAGASKTSSYTLMNFSLSRRIALSNRVDLNLHLRANNLLDATVRHHTAYNKDEVMQAGRNFTLGARFQF